GGPSNVAFINQGTIAADNSGSIITLNGSGWSNDNSGRISAVTGATVNLAGTATNTSRSITLSGSGTIMLQGTISSGSVDMINGARLASTAGALDGVTVNGDLDISTASGAFVTLTNGLTLNGTAFLGNSSGSTYGYLRFNGTQTFNGNGTVLFGGNAGL